MVQVNEMKLWYCVTRSKNSLDLRKMKHDDEALCFNTILISPNDYGCIRRAEAENNVFFYQTRLRHFPKSSGIFIHLMCQRRN